MVEDGSSNKNITKKELDQRKAQLKEVKRSIERMNPLVSKKEEDLLMKMPELEFQLLTSAMTNWHTIDAIGTHAVLNEAKSGLKADRKTIEEHIMELRLNHVNMDGVLELIKTSKEYADGRLGFVMRIVTVHKRRPEEARELFRARQMIDQDLFDDSSGEAHVLDIPKLIKAHLDFAQSGEPINAKWLFEAVRKINEACVTVGQGGYYVHTRLWYAALTKKRYEKGFGVLFKGGIDAEHICDIIERTGGVFESPLELNQDEDIDSRDLHENRHR